MMSASNYRTGASRKPVEIHSAPGAAEPNSIFGYRTNHGPTTHGKADGADTRDSELASLDGGVNSE